SLILSSSATYPHEIFSLSLHDALPILPELVSILHIDADWYDSVLLALNTFYDRVAEGGIVVLDDFGHKEGCREAFYDFISQRHRSEEHTSELQSRSDLVCRLLLEKKKR